MSIVSCVCLKIRLAYKLEDNGGLSEGIIYYTKIPFLVQDIIFIKKSSCNSTLDRQLNSLDYYQVTNTTSK